MFCHVKLVATKYGLIFTFSEADPIKRFEAKSSFRKGFKVATK
jgi:hypothetical protein